MPVTLEVCKCCALSENEIANAVARIKERHGNQVKVIEANCLDVCQDTAAVKLNGKILLLTPENLATFEEKVRQSLDPQI